MLKNYKVNNQIKIQWNFNKVLLFCLESYNIRFNPKNDYMGNEL